jgi:thioredoxin reductase (NADPH)
MLELIIIGAGPAGLYAGFIAGLRHLQTVLLESLPFSGGQLTTMYPEKPVYDIPGFSNILARDFITHLKQQHQPFASEVPIHYQQKVVQIISHPTHYQVLTEKGNQFEGKSILIATGSGIMKPQSIPSHRIEGEVPLHFTIDQPESLAKQHITILGGGDSAFDWANVLSQQGHEVTVVHHRREFRAFDHSLSTFQKQGTILAPYTIERIYPKDFRYGIDLIQSETQQLQSVLTDMILVCYGYQPAPHGYEDWGLQTEKGLLVVNRTLQTNLERVYAIGNAVTYEGKSQTIAGALGEVTQAMEQIYRILRPKQRMVYSSALKDPLKI